MYSLSEVRKSQYEYRRAQACGKDAKHWDYINKPKKNPYSWLKARLYMETGAFLAYLLLKTKIKPNTVTLVYCLSGIAGGVLLAIGSKVTVLAAVFIFFLLKGMLDWSDGLLARIRKDTSVTGDILDRYGGLLGEWAFLIGLGFYVAQKSGWIGWYYLIPLIPLCSLGKIHSFAFSVFYKEYITPDEIKKRVKQKASDSTMQSREEEAHTFPQKVNNVLIRYLGPRAMTVDFVCLLLLIEAFTPIFITQFVFLVFVLKEVITFFGSFYVISKGGWVEKELENKLEEISGAFPRGIDKDKEEVLSPKE